MVDKQTEQLKSVFKDNEYLLKVIRNLFFGLEVSEQDKLMVKDTFKDQDFKETFRKKFYARRGDDANLGNISDFWVGLGDDKIIGQAPETINQIVESRKLLYTMFEKAFSLLENPDGEKVLSGDYEANTMADPFQITLLARNKYLNSVEAGLSFINIIANTKDKTPEQIKEELKKNSSK